MKIPEKYRGRYFYHFTHIDNISSIVENNGLLSTNLKKKYGINHHNVANMNIQNRRSEMRVTVGPGGVVHDYVPFYFASTNKMLLGLLNRKVVDQPYVVFLAVSIEKLLEDNVVFTDASANTTLPPNFYCDPNDLDKLNWDLIDSTKWGEKSETELHLRMAEVLIYGRVPLEWVDAYIVFNKIGKRKIIECYNNAGLLKPYISYDWFNNRSFFFTKFFFKDRENETLVTGPLQLYESYQIVVRSIRENRNSINKGKCILKNIRDAIIQIKDDFCVIQELADIYDLKTDNYMHHESVSDHTITVVNNLPNTQYYTYLGEREKAIVKLAAYFHDIGKGPKEKWEDGIQKAYLDHPADALTMLERIFSEDFEEIKYEDYRDICLLVAYHDLLGDIIGNGRSEKELEQLELSINMLYMLATLSEADICAIGGTLSIDIRFKIQDLLNYIMR